MTYKEMAIDKLFRENVCDPDVSRVLLKLNDILKDARYIDESFMYTHIKPVLTNRTMTFMRDNGGLFCAYDSEFGFELVDEQNIVTVFSIFLNGGKLSEKQMKGICIWTLKLIKPFAKKWKQKVIEVANDIKENS